MNKSNRLPWEYVNTRFVMKRCAASSLTSSLDENRLFKLYFSAYRLALEMACKAVCAAARELRVKLLNEHTGQRLLGFTARWAAGR